MTRKCSVVLSLALIALSSFGAPAVASANPTLRLVSSSPDPDTLTLKYTVKGLAKSKRNKLVLTETLCGKKKGSTQTITLTKLTGTVNFPGLTEDAYCAKGQVKSGRSNLTGVVKTSSQLYDALDLTLQSGQGDCVAGAAGFIVAALNSKRESLGLADAKENTQLDNAAKAQSIFMATQGTLTPENFTLYTFRAGFRKASTAALGNAYTDADSFIEAAYESDPSTINDSFYKQAGGGCITTNGGSTTWLTLALGAK